MEHKQHDEGSRDLLPNMEIMVSANFRDDARDCDDISIGSLRDLVSQDGDSLLLDDDHGFEESSDACPPLQRLSTTSFSTAVTDMDHSGHQFSSLRSISTEMAIIASSSPEIKALSEQPITPTYYSQDFNCNLFQQQQQSKAGSVESDSSGDFANESSLSHRVAARSAIDTSSAREAAYNNDTFMDDADELAFYMERSSIGSTNRPSPLVTMGQKENVMPPFEFNAETPEASNTTRSQGRAFTFKSSMKSEQKHHRSLSSVGKRPSCHRRVSFDSLPSPVEIATSQSERQQQHRPTVHTTCTVQRSKSFELGTKSPLAMDFPF